MTTCTKSMNIYYSEVTLLLQSFIFLFEPIYKNIYFTVTKLDIFENRKILFYTSVMAVSKLCTPSSKSFVVKRPPGSKVQDFTNRFCFHSSKTLHDHLVLSAVDFGTALSTLFFSSSTLFGCRNLSNDFVAVYILTKRN